MNWHIYILRLESPSFHKLRNGTMKCYYTGITRRGIGIRFGDHLKRRGHSWLNTMMRDATRVPVYVELLEGTDRDALRRERIIKQMNSERKEALIASEKNALVGYKPTSHLILRLPDGSETVEYIV